jgi:hypothetical protein
LEFIDPLRVGFLETGYLNGGFYAKDRDYFDIYILKSVAREPKYSTVKG